MVSFTPTPSSNRAIVKPALGQLQPYLPGVIEAYRARENEFLATDYFDWIPAAFATFYKESEECSVMQDQPCLTMALELLLDDILQGLSGVPDAMLDVHYGLESAVRDLLQLHQRAEWGERTAALFFQSALSAQILEASIDEWNDARRTSQ